MGSFPRGDKREEGLFCRHRPQFGVWSAGDESVLCSLRSDPCGVPGTRRHRGTPGEGVNPLEKQRWVNSHCVTEKTLDLGGVPVPVEVISASQTGTSTSQTQPHQPAVPWSLQPGPTRVRGVGARLVGSGALRSWDVLWEGMSESVCGE